MTTPSRAVFVNRNSREFDTREIAADLRQLNCSYKPTFAAGLAYVRAELGSRKSTNFYPAAKTPETGHNLAAIAAVNSVVVAVPPRSAVRTFPSSNTASIAFRIRAAFSASPKSWSIASAGMISGNGFAASGGTDSCPAP